MDSTRKNLLSSQERLKPMGKRTLVEMINVQKNADEGERPRGPRKKKSPTTLNRRKSLERVPLVGWGEHFSRWGPAANLEGVSRVGPSFRKKGTGGDEGKGGNQESPFPPLPPGRNQKEKSCT